jgi:HK97 family phage prohead protease
LAAPKEIDTGIETREIPSLSLRASFKPDTIDEEKRTVDLVWTTGAKVLRGYYDRYYEELSLDPKHVRMERLTSGRAPLLNSHDGFDLGSVLGVVESAKLEKSKGVARVRFAKAEDSPEADRIFRLVKDGIITSVSVGYRVHRLEKVEDGDDKIPTMRATSWEPYELSLVAMPADAGAGVRSAQQPLPLGAQPTNPCIFITRSQEPTTMDPIKNETPAPVTAAAPASLDAAREQKIREEAVTAERERSAGIRAAVRALKLDDEFGEDLVKRNVKLDEARRLIFDEVAKRDEAVPTENHVRIEVTDDAQDRWKRGASAWLFQKAGVAPMVRAAQKADPDNGSFNGVSFDPGEFRGFTLVDLARASLERRGVKTTGMSRFDLVGKALTHRSGYQSTSDFAVLLENVMHKTLLAAYGTTPDTWTRFCARGSVSDFREHHRYRMGTLGTLEKVNEHGEFKHAAIPDGAKEKISASTKGKIISLTRQAIINDDMDAFSRLATMFGRAAKLTIEVDVYAMLAENSGLGPTMNDGVTLFHANHANISTGAALSASALDADRVKMGEQKDPSSNEILDLRPAILLVPISLGGTARVINESQYDPDTVANKAQMKPNLVRGLFRDVVDTPRLSGTRRYLFADPAVAPTIEVVFLDGQSEPFMESQDGFTVDGTKWKVRLDFGIAPVDYRGAITNAGV